MENLKEILSLWKIDFKSEKTVIEISGSPKRSVSRTVIEDTEENLFIIEEIFDNTVKSRERQAKALEYLNGQGFQMASPYFIGSNRDYIQKYGESLYMLREFVQGIPLSRPAYLKVSVYGKEAAQFISELQRKSLGIESVFREKPFNIAEYIENWISLMKEQYPDIFQSIKPPLKQLREKLYPILDLLPMTFSHGDFHPLNIIWSKANILTVIDWEFCGFKHDVYDAANFIGCLGFENPDGLNGELYKAFMYELHEVEFFNRRSWEALPLFIVALRFAWLFRWIVDKDEEMIDLETTYINLLIKQLTTDH